MVATIFGTIYNEPVVKWGLGADTNGLKVKWSYDGPPTVGPSIYRQNNLRAYQLRGGESVLVAQPSLDVDSTSLLVGIVIGVLAAPYVLKAFKKK